MHQAPAVRYPLGPSHFAAGLLAAVWAGAALNLLAAAFQHPAPAVLLSSGAFAALLGGALTLWWWRTQPRGELQWDGTQWLWEADSSVVAGTLHVQVDLQAYLWIEWRTLGTGKAKWMWLERRSQPTRWDDIRRAVFA